MTEFATSLMITVSLRWISKEGKAMKCYRYEHKDGTVIKVRFYNTGCYTVVDKNGAHEAGQWFKKQQFLNEEYGIRSKDKNAVYFEYQPFGKKKSRAYSYQENMARTIATDWYHTNKK